MSTPSSPHPSDSLPPSDGEAPAPPPRPRRRLRRALRWSGIGFGVLVGSTLFWSAVWTWYNPQVDLAKPRVVTRPAPPAGRDITLVLGGDFAPVDRFPPVAPRLGWGFPYRRTARLLRNADVTFLNLEAPITAHAKQFFLYKTYNYRVDPAALPAWDALGLDVVSLANNHVKDRRNQGLRDTLEHLRRVGIESVGAGTNEAAARRPLIIDVGGTRIGFLAYLQDWWWYNLYLDIFARGSRPGCARFVRSDVEKDVRRLRPWVDVLVVSMHWGRNYRPVNEDQERDARFLSSLGVDIIAGHHPHDIQRVQWIGHTLVIYSLGNYAWGTPGHGSMRVGLLARLYLSQHTAAARGRLRAVTFLPLVTQNRIVHLQPRAIRRSEKRWLNTFLSRSRAHGAKLTWRGIQLDLAVPPAKR